MNGVYNWTLDGNIRYEYRSYSLHVTRVYEIEGGVCDLSDKQPISDEARAVLESRGIDIIEPEPEPSRFERVWEWLSRKI